jgi:hypothetical protein
VCGLKLARRGNRTREALARVADLNHIAHRFAWTEGGDVMTWMTPGSWNKNIAIHHVITDDQHKRCYRRYHRSVGTVTIDRSYSPDSTIVWLFTGEGVVQWPVIVFKIVSAAKKKTAELIFTRGVLLYVAECSFEWWTLLASYQGDAADFARWCGISEAFFFASVICMHDIYLACLSCGGGR